MSHTDNSISRRTFLGATGAASLMALSGEGAAADYDICIYGGTAAAVTAAVQAKQMGKTVIIVSPDKQPGGLSSGGLGFTDTGNKAVIGGLAREFYHRVWQRYQKPETCAGNAANNSAISGNGRGNGD